MERILEGLYNKSIAIAERLYALAEKEGNKRLAKKLGVEGNRAEKLSIELGKLLLPPPSVD